jgi:hypothetical protein
MSSFRVLSSYAVTISTLISLAAGQAPMPGIASRYWDCCKPACSWPNGNPISSPVKICAIDGSTITDPSARSGCQGGPAYACTGFQPWSASPQLAYGFAAVSVAGESAGDSCCACYELTFTNGPAQGQQMIVQATNTGADLGTNQFDLQVSGKRLQGVSRFMTLVIDSWCRSWFVQCLPHAVRCSSQCFRSTVWRHS